MGSTPGCICHKRREHVGLVRKHSANRLDQKRIILEDIDEDEVMAASAYFGSVEVHVVDVNMQANAPTDDIPQPCYHRIPREADQVARILGEVSPILDDQYFYHSLVERAELGKFQASIGSTNVSDSNYLVDDSVEAKNSTSSSDNSSVDSEQLLDDLFEKSMRGDINLDAIMVGASHTAKAKGINAQHLAKTWRIDLDSAKQALDVTTQSKTRKDKEGQTHFVSQLWNERLHAAI
jgi:K+-transporting ATPase c subunit